MKTVFKRSIALLLSLLMIFSVCGTTLLASALGESSDAAKGYTLEEFLATWNWLKNYTSEKTPALHEVVLQADEYVSTKEFAILYTQLQEVYLKYDQSTTPEQKASLAKRAYELTTRLQAGAAKYTAKKYSGNYYVSIGDSTLTGYGLDEYVPGMNNGEGQVLGTEAPVLLAQKLFGNDYQSHFKKLDKGGLRVDDLLVWLGEEEFIDDFYNRYTMDANAVVSQTEYYQVLFESEIKKADLITVALGGGNITTFIAQQINALKSGSELYEMDWTKYLPDTDPAEIDGYVASLKETLQGKLPEIYGVPGEVVASVAAESFLFGLVGYMNNYPKVLDRIHEINPNAHVVVVSYFNPVDNMVIPAMIDNELVEIPFGTMLGTLMEACNAGSLKYALENKENTTYVSISETTTILDELGRFDLESQLEGMMVNTWLTHAGPKGHQYIADQIYNAIQNEYTKDEIADETFSYVTHADYYIDNSSSYVALGDGTIYSQIFADSLAKYVADHNPPYVYNTTNLTVADSSIATLPAILAQNIQTIATADLISVGYSYEQLAQETVYIVFDLLLSGKTKINTEVDWVSLVGADLAATIESKIAELYLTMAAQGLNVPLNAMLPFPLVESEVTIADAVITAAEYFAYYAAEYALYMPQVVNTIHAINPEALVMVLAMSNPLSGTSISLMGKEIVFGDFLDYLVDATNAESVLYTALFENVVFVPATEVETNHTDYTITVDASNILTLYMQYAMGNLFVIETTAAGNAYVVDKMFGSLDITVEVNKPGDANGDGAVTFKDAILVARYEAGLENAIDISVSDVDGDGHIGFKDAILIARYEAGLVESFPAFK